MHMMPFRFNSTRGGGWMSLEDISSSKRYKNKHFLENQRRRSTRMQVSVCVCVCVMNLLAEIVQRTKG